MWICEFCGKNFSISYKVSKKHIFRFCSKRCKTLAQFSRPKNKLLEMIKEEVLSAFHETGIVPTLQETVSRCHISSKTFPHSGIKFTDILKELNLPYSRNKFQCSVVNILKGRFDEVITEQSFEGLVNPITGQRLRIDIFIPSIPLAVECNGKQHTQPDHWFNRITSANGFTPVIQTDLLKRRWMEEHQIPLVDIPYTRTVSQDYVFSFLPEMSFR